MAKQRDGYFSVHMKDSQDRHLDRCEKAALRYTYDALVNGKFKDQGMEVGNSSLDGPVSGETSPSARNQTLRHGKEQLTPGELPADLRDLVEIKDAIEKKCNFTGHIMDSETGIMFDPKNMPKPGGRRKST